MTRASTGPAKARMRGALRYRPLPPPLVLAAALGIGLVCGSVRATTVTIDPAAQAWGRCAASFHPNCASSGDPVLLAGLGAQGVTMTSSVEYALPTLPKGAVLLSASLSLGAYSRSNVDHVRGWQDKVLGTLDVTSFVGDGTFDPNDPFHQEQVDFTLTQAATRLYDITGLVNAYSNAGTSFIGFAFWQSPPGVCGFGTDCELEITGDTTEFAFQRDPANAHAPQLFLEYADAAPPPLSPVPEPTTWLMFLGGLGSLGLATQRRRRRPV